MPTRQVRRPEDILVFIVEELHRQGYPLAPGYDVDIAALEEGVPPGPEYLRLTEHQEVAEQHYGWYRHRYGSGSTVYLTAAGVARARQLTVEPEIWSRLRESASAQIQARRENFLTKRVRALTQSHAARGILDSSVYFGALDDLVAEEVEERARLTWGLYARALRARAAEFSSELASRVKMDIAAVLRDTADDLREALARPWRKANTQSPVEDALERALDRGPNRCYFTSMQR